MEDQYNSRAYRRYFEGYAETRSLDERGRMVTRRIYVGNYYRVKCGDGALLLQKVLFGLFYLLAALLYFGAGMTIRADVLPAVDILTMASLAVLILLLPPVFRRLTAPREMEVRQWREGSAHLRRAGLAATVCLFLTAAATLLSCLFHEGSSLVEDLPCVAMDALAGLLALGIYLLERHTEYEVLPPKHKCPEGATLIRRDDAD